MSISIIHRSSWLLGGIVWTVCLSSLADIASAQPQPAAAKGVGIVPKPAAAKGVGVVPIVKKWALVIGVDHYQDKRFGNLQFCGADAQALRDVLVRQGGFPADQVLLLNDQQKPDRRPLRGYVEQSLKALLAQAGPQDLVLVSFSGHGIQVGETAYLCPTEADLDKPEATMVSVASLYEKLSKECRAAQKIVFVDACRKPVESGQKAPALELTKGFSERLQQVPEGLLILSSCKSGQFSYEEKELGHAVFSHFLLDGLNGKADARGPDLHGNGDGRIDVDELFNYASTQTGKYVMNKRVQAQTPELYGVRRGPIDLLAALPDVREILDKALRVARSISDESSSARSLTRIALARMKAGDMDGARLLFGEALRVIRSIKDEFPRATALNAIAIAQGEAEDKQSAHLVLEETLQAARTISNESSKATTLNTIAISQAKAGEKQSARLLFEEALRITSSINNSPPSFGRDSVMSDIAKGQDSADDFVAALEAARAIYDANWAAFTLANIAASQAASGDGKSAKATIQEALTIARDSKRYEPRTTYSGGSEFRAFAWIALAQARSGLGTEASATVRNELLPRWKTFELSSGRSATSEFCRAQVENDAAMEVYELVSKVQDPNDQVIVLVCLAQSFLIRQKLLTSNDLNKGNELRVSRQWVTTDGLFDGTFELNYEELNTTWFGKLWFTETRNPSKQSAPHRPVALKNPIPKVDELLDKALRAARSVSDEHGRAQCLIKVANELATVGNMAAAQIALADAVRAAKSIRDESTRSATLSEIEAAKSMTGQDSSFQMLVLSTAAYEQAKGGDFASSLVTARRIKSLGGGGSVGVYALTLTGIAAVQAEVGNPIDAKATIREALASTADLKPGGDEFVPVDGIAFAVAAIGQAKSGFGIEALATVRDVLFPRWPKDSPGLFSGNETILAEFCRAQVKYGCASELYEFVSSIPNSSDQVVMLVCLAEAILEQQKSAVSKTSSDSNQPAK